MTGEVWAYDGFQPPSVPVTGKHRAESATLQLNLWPWGSFSSLQQGGSILPQGFSSRAGDAQLCAPPLQQRLWGWLLSLWLNPVPHMTPGIPPVAGGLY